MTKRDCKPKEKACKKTLFPKRFAVPKCPIHWQNNVALSVAHISHETAQKELRTTVQNGETRNFNALGFSSKIDAKAQESKVMKLLIGPMNPKWTESYSNVTAQKQLFQESSSALEVAGLLDHK